MSGSTGARKGSRVFTLPEGHNCRVRIDHVTVQHRGEERRATKVLLTVGRRRFTETAVCSPGDNFCRATGRRYAADKLLARLRSDESLAGEVGKAGRDAIFKTICPQFRG